MTILLVEPDDDLAALLTFLLRRDGHDVMTVRDEASAQRRLSTKPATLVIAATALSAVRPRLAFTSAHADDCVSYADLRTECEKPDAPPMMSTVYSCLRNRPSGPK